LTRTGVVLMIWGVFAPPCAFYLLAARYNWCTVL